jgi:hypothetical protein
MTGIPIYSRTACSPLGTSARCRNGDSTALGWGPVLPVEKCPVLHTSELDDVHASQATGNLGRSLGQWGHLHPVEFCVFPAEIGTGILEG